jgi:hypothetical protein
MTFDLADLVADFAGGLMAADSRCPQAINQRSKVAYQPGIGPHPETATVELVLSELRRGSPELYGKSAVGVPYEAGSRQKCDVAFGQSPDWDWLIEVKMIRMLGDNAKANDNLPTHILSPYPAHRSALTDCVKLATSHLDGRKAILIYGYESGAWPLAPLVEAFEALARLNVEVGRRHTASFEGLIHPVHSAGSVYAWEISAQESDSNPAGA